MYVVFWWPRMAITFVSPGVKQTANEPGICFVFATQDDAQVACTVIQAAIDAGIPPLHVENSVANIPCVIPPTPVREIDHDVWDWQVDACTGTGTDDAGNTVTMQLPKEPVVWERFDGYRHKTMVAVSVDTQVTVTITNNVLLGVNGQTYTGTVTLPDCPTQNPITAPVAVACYTEPALLQAV
jgi:hypothetical protein